MSNTTRANHKRFLKKTIDLMNRHKIALIRLTAVQDKTFSNT